MLPRCYHNCSYGDLERRFSGGFMDYKGYPIYCYGISQEPNRLTAVDHKDNVLTINPDDPDLNIKNNITGLFLDKQGILYHLSRLPLRQYSQALNTNNTMYLTYKRGFGEALDIESLNVRAVNSFLLGVKGTQNFRRMEISEHVNVNSKKNKNMYRLVPGFPNLFLSLPSFIKMWRGEYDRYEALPKLHGFYPISPMYFIDRRKDKPDIIREYTGRKIATMVKGMARYEEEFRWLAQSVERNTGIQPV